MARTVATIKSEIKTEVRTHPELDGFKFPEDTPAGSKVGVFNLMIDVVSIAIFTFEVILDSLKAQIQAIADRAPAGNARWVQTQIKRFQFGDVVQLVDFVPTYNPIIEANRIVTQCAVKDLGNGIIAIKVAKGASAPFSPLSSPEMSALQNYYYGTSETEGIGFAGVRAQFVSLNADRLYVQANIYFLGQYVSETVKANVITAINNFLYAFADDAFNGRVFMIKLVDAIQAVAGVSRVELSSVKARPNTTPFVSASVVPIQGFYDTVAGHIISEDTASNTLNESLTMIEEIG